MSDTFRSGNSRLLAKQLDQLAWPVVVLDQRAQIVFISAPLCELLQVDGTRLVGFSCSATLPDDASAHPQLAMLLAPPSEVLHGQAVSRLVPWPPTSPVDKAVQVFLPLIDSDPSQGLILVLFGEPESMAERFALLGGAVASRPAQADELLLRLRAQWQQLDGLQPLLGTSPSISVAMRRAQLALQSPANVWIGGPVSCGGGDVARALPVGRSKKQNLPLPVVQIQVIDCAVSDVDLVSSSLESFESRMRHGAPAGANHLILEHMDRASNAALGLLSTWIEAHAATCSVISTSKLAAEDWAKRGVLESRLAATLSTIEIELTPLAARREDVSVLIQNALATAAMRAGRRLPAIATATLELLQSYPWPGNLPEVQQAATEMLTNAVLTATIQPQHLPLSLRTFGSTLAAGRPGGIEPIDLDDVLLQLERVMIERAIRLSPRNRARAARLLGISRPRFLRRIAQLGLDHVERPNGPADSDEEE